MRKSLREWIAVLLLPIMAAAGCGSKREFYFFNKYDLKYYTDVATQIEHPDLTCPTPVIPTPTRPLSLEELGENDYWNLTLQEAVQISLANSKVLRQVNVIGGGSLAGLTGRPVVPGVVDRTLAAPQTATTVFDSAIQESNVVGPIGVEAALSAFDAQLSVSSFWERRERPVNAGGFGDLIFAPVAISDNATFQAELSKTNATGGRTYLQNNVVYLSSNSPTRAVPSDYYVDYIAGIEQPLLQGAGLEFNRIAGPNATPGINQGVLIARINGDQELADFEIAVRNMVSDVENLYWLLYQTYRSLDASRAARDNARADWERIMLLREKGGRGGDKQSEAQARAQYLRFQGELENALNDLYRAENRLRFIMGIPASDGRLIRPSDEPTMARIIFDWDEIHVEAMARSAELRRQKWQVKRRELELIAARNYLLPRLDAVALYRWLGQGDTLLDPNGRPFPPFAGSDAFATLTSGDFQEWQLGFQFNMPLGFRREMTYVRNTQLMLAREHAILQDQEMELSHQLAEALRNMESQYKLSQTLYNSWSAAFDEYVAVREKVAGGVAIDNDVIDALSRLVQAENQFYSALTQYNRAIIEVHLRKGSLLEYNGVYLAEGPWSGKAYADARDKARARSQPPQFHQTWWPQRPPQISNGPDPGPIELLPAPVPLKEETLPGPAGEEIPPGDAAPAIDGPAIAPPLEAPPPPVDGEVKLQGVPSRLPPPPGVSPIGKSVEVGTPSALDAVRSVGLTMPDRTTDLFRERSTAAATKSEASPEPAAKSDK